MGFLTTVTIRNDRLHEYEQDPKQLGLDILKGMEQAQLNYRTNKQCSRIIVQPSFHADNHQIFLHWGNSVTNVTAYGNDLKHIYQTSPDIAEELVKKLNSMARESREYLRKLRDEKKLAAKS